MKKLCIMITHKFPYNQDETFIENEISLLSDAFETVYILAAYASEKDVQTRTLPSNVMVSRLGYQSLSLGKKVLLALKGLFLADKLIWQEVRKKQAIGWKANCFYMYGTVMDMAAKATKQLDSFLNIRSFDNCVMYSYWFLEHAILGNQLALQYKDIVPVSFVSRAHRYDVYSNRRKYQAFPFRDLVLANIDAVFPCSQDGTNHLSQTHPLYADKFHTAYLGTTDYGVNAEADGGQFVIVSCSNIVEVKRVHLIAQALSLILKQGYTSFLWICIGDGNLLPGIKALVTEELSIGEHVEFVGRLSNSQVMELYEQRHIDMLVNVSESEGLPVSIMEAQSFGIPCFATDVGGTSEIINNDVGQLLPEDISSSQLAEFLKYFMDLPSEKRETYRINSRKNWLALFDAQKNFHEWAIQLSSLCT